MRDAARLAELVEELEELQVPAVPALLDVWIKAAYGGSYWDEILSGVVRAREGVEDFERLIVKWARLDGETWADVASALGLSRQGAQKRYGFSGSSELDALENVHQAERELLMQQMKLRAARERQGQPVDASSEGKSGALQISEADWDEWSSLFDRQHQELSDLRATLRDGE